MKRRELDGLSEVGLPYVGRYLNQSIMRSKANYVLEADIKGFFDNVDHDWLMEFLAHDIEDKKFLCYVKQFLIVGVMEGTEQLESNRDTPQGGQISLILPNVYLHYVLDLLGLTFYLQAL